MKLNNMNEKKQYTMFDLKMLNEDVWYWENVISSPENLIETLEYLDTKEISYERIPKWKDWLSSAEDKHHYGSVKKFEKEKFYISSGDEMIDKQSLYIINSFIMAVEMCWNQYVKEKKINSDDYFCQSEALILKKFLPNQHMGPHFDGQGGDHTLAFTLIIYPNDDYEGGELVFPNHDINIKPKAGSLIIFPAQMPYIHQVLEIKNKPRYILTALVIKKDEYGKILHLSFE